MRDGYWQCLDFLDVPTRELFSLAYSPTRVDFRKLERVAAEWADLIKNRDKERPPCCD